MSDMSMGAIWSSIPVPVLVIGEKDIISQINPAAEGFLNMSERALVGTSLWRCISIHTQVSMATRSRIGRVIFSKVLCDGDRLSISPQ